jgi:mono/diheme cytochrome c family protein
MRALPLSALVLAAAALPQEAAPSPEQRAWFETAVRPLLAERCHGCHGPTRQKSGLRLDHRSFALRGGARGPALVPGDPGASRMIAAIGYGDSDLQMPPKSKLADAEIETLTEWVRRGAYWPDEPAPAAAAADAKTFDLDGRRAAHWAWQPVQRPEIPDVGDRGWPRDPVDRFVLARLERAELAPAPDAEPATWLRRVHFDLVGLPPTPAELDAFDGSAGGRADAVDRLLASPHFGERWARHWLDLVRYAETMGHEYDYPIHGAWRYRDWVVRALNADLPYDRFVREQIAGDLLAEPRRNPEDGSNESVIATAFWWFGDQTHSPVDVRKATADRIDNQIDVAGKTFLALTVGCARCHDHKFDAIAQRDYYALFGYALGSRFIYAATDPPERDRPVIEHLAGMQPKLLSEAHAAWRAGAAGIADLLRAADLVERDRRAAAAADGKVDEKKLSKDERTARRERLEAEESARLGAFAARTSLPRARLERWVRALRDRALDDIAHPLHAWRALTAEKVRDVAASWRELLASQPEPARPRGRAPIVLADFDRGGFDGWRRDGHAFGDGPVRPGDTVLPGRDGRVFAQMLSGGWAHSGAVSHRLQGTLHSPTFTLTKRFVHVRAAGREARINLVLEGFNLIRAPIYGHLKQIVNAHAPRWYSIDVGLWQGKRAYVQLNDLTLPDPGDDDRPNGYPDDAFLAVQRIVLSDDREPEPARADIADLLGAWPVQTIAELAQRFERATLRALAAAQPYRAHRSALTAGEEALLDWLLAHELLEPRAALRASVELYARIESTIPPPALVPAMADGTGEDAALHVRGNPGELGERVPRRFLQALGGQDRAHTPRGCGRLELAEAIADPDNPLVARAIVNRLWQHLFGRGIVATVDNFGVLGSPPSHPELLDWLASQLVAESWSLKRTIRRLVLSRTYAMDSAPTDASHADPDNVLWHRMPVRRLEGEAIRDAILAVSGRLDRRPFGPSVPVHLTPFLDGRGRPGRSGPLDGDGRRSVYQEVRRNFLNPTLLAFDTPTPFATVGQRSVSNVPAQALVLLNDPFVVGQARLWAERALDDDEAPARERVERLYRSAFARAPTPGEANAALAFVLEQSERHGVPPDAPEPWADLCHVLLNTKEFVFVR